MNSIEICLGANNYVLKSAEETQDHLHEVATLVEKTVEATRAQHPHIGVQKAAILAACDLASRLLKGHHQARAYQTAVLDRAGRLLERVEKELKHHA